MPPSSRPAHRHRPGLIILLAGLLLASSASLAAPAASDARRFKFPQPPQPTSNPSSFPTQSPFPGPGFPKGPKPPKPPQVQLTLQVPAQATAGRSTGITATLTQGGQALPGGTVTFQVNSSFIGSSTTDVNGNAGFTVPGTSIPNPGTYQIQASASGFFAPAFASANLVVVAKPPPPPPQPPLGTSITIQAPSETEVGQDTTVTATLHNAYGRVMVGSYIVINVQGSQLKSGLTDGSGRFIYTIPGRKLPTQGAYVIQAQYMGAHLLAPSSAQVTMNVVPAAIEVQTVPPVSGIVFTLGGVASNTGPDGIATWPIPENGPYKMTADLNPAGSTTVRTGFVGWADGTPTLERTVTVSGPATYVVGLKVAYLDTLQYLDTSGNPIDPSRVDQATIVSQDGTPIVINPQTQSSFWSTAEAATPIPNSNPPALRANSISYKVTSVRVHGVEALAPGDQPVWTPDQAIATAKLAVYALTVRTMDAVTGAPADGMIRVSWANGASSSLPARGGVAVFDVLPVGQYVVSRGAGPGPLSGRQTIMVSGPETDLLPVFTFTDVIMAAIAALSIVCLLLAILLVIRTRRRNRAVQRWELEHQA